MEFLTNVPIKILTFEPDVLVVDWYRAAISVKGDANREAAIQGLHEKLSMLQTDAALNRSALGQAGVIVPTDELAKSLTYSMVERASQIAVFEDALRDFQQHKQVALFSAEVIARAIWEAIVDDRYTGVHSEGGIIEQVSQLGRSQKMRGMIDQDTLRNNWKEYKGVAHLGAGLLVARAAECDDETAVLIAEEIRYCLSHECPKGQKKPYVDESDQFFFIFRSEG